MTIEEGMLISYDPEIDALFIGLRRVKPVDSQEIGEDVTLDLDEQGQLVSLEILDVTENLGAEALKHLIVEGLTTIVRPGEPSEIIQTPALIPDVDTSSSAATSK